MKNPESPPIVDAILVQLQTRGGTAAAASLAGTEHLGISYLAAALESARLRVKVIDLEDERLSLIALAEEIARYGPSLVGLSPTSATANDALELSIAIKRHIKSTAIVWGGHLATGLKSQLFNLTSCVDAIVLGEADRLIASLCIAAKESGLAAFPNVSRNPASTFPSVPPPILPDTLSWHERIPSRHKTAAFYRTNGARILTSLGCPYDCTFCTTPSFSNRRITQRKVTHIETEIRDLVLKYEIERVWINDDLFCDGSLSSRRRALTIAAAMRKAAPWMKFRAMLRADLIARDPTLIKELSTLGLDTVFVGLESGNAGDLDAFRKRTLVATNQKATEALHALGIFLQIGFIMFSSCSSIESILKNCQFLRSIGQLYRFFPLSRTVQIFPGTELWSYSTEWDEERSNSFLRLPKFRDPTIRTLSIAFEELEKIFAKTDHDAYARRKASILTDHESQYRANQLMTFVEEACTCARRGATPDDLIFQGERVAKTLSSV